MLGLLLLLIWLALSFGAKDLVGHAKSFIGTVLALAAAICLLRSCVCLAQRTRAQSPVSLSDAAVLFVLLAVLSMIGYVCWRFRERRAAQRVIRDRRDGAARAHALPPPSIGAGEAQ